MRFAVAVLIVVCLGSTPARAAEGYEAMVARVKAGDVALDYRALRDAYAQSAHYQPEGGDYDEPRTAMLDAFNAQDCVKALAAADKVLNAVFIDITAHIVSGRCFELASDSAKAAFHRTVARGLMASILASGDGKTPKTAFVVVTISEEYDVLTALRLKPTLQALVQDDGHSYDKQDAKSATGETATLFFQIDRPMAWLSRSLQH
jgi:hypothetical protein